MNIQNDDSLLTPNSLSVDHWFRSGVDSLKRGDVLGAANCMQQVISIDRSHAEAWNNLGVMLAQHGRFESAVSCFQYALQLKPDFGDATRNFTKAKLDLEKHGGDPIASAKPFELQGVLNELLYSQAILSMANGELDAAEQKFKLVLSKNFEHGMAHHGLAMLYVERGELQEAITSLDRAIAISPEFADARYDRARLYLQLGNFESGWPELEYRWKRRGVQQRRFVQPRWDGAPMDKGTILIHAEQGIGDVIQFVRYTRIVKEAFRGKVLFACPSTLNSLLSTCEGIDRMVDMGPEFPPFDVHIPLMSLPLLFNTTLQTVPSRVAYLAADRTLIEFWRHDLSGISGFKIGIVWRGNSTYDRDHQRSIPLRHFEPIARLPNVRLISLLKGTMADEMKEFGNKWPILDLDRRIDESGSAFSDTAAIMMNLDLVIAADTSAAHLAGALGVPIWLAQWKVPEWRWLMGRESSPWYPSMRLCQQRVRGDWDELFSRLAEDIREMLSHT